MAVVVLMTLWTFLLREGMPLFTELLISQLRMNWTLAEEYCIENNGRLIVLDSQEKLDYFTSHDQYQEKHLDEETYWIGMRFNDSIKCDQTKDYNPWLYTGWGRWTNTNNEPNWCPSQQCVQLRLIKMRTTWCTRQFKALCERDTNKTAASSTELVEIKSVTSSITSSKPEHNALSPTIITTASTPEADVTRYMDSSSRSAVSTTAALITSELENDTCRKCCSSQEVNLRKFNQYELDEGLVKLRVQLTVNKTEVSIQRRKLISVYDSRPSNVAMGGIACAILLTVIGVIVVPDVLALGRFMCKRVPTPHKTLVI